MKLPPKEDLVLMRGMLVALVLVAPFWSFLAGLVIGRLFR